MPRTTKNYTENGGDKTVIGGELNIAAGGKLTVGESEIDFSDFVTEVPEIPVAANQADSVATDVPGLVTDFNALLAKLKTAGLMASE